MTQGGGGSEKVKISVTSFMNGPKTVLELFTPICNILCNQLKKKKKSINAGTGENRQEHSRRGRERERERERDIKITQMGLTESCL